MKRRLEIDAARGAMLVWMTLTHLPTALTPWVNQPFGYISASEGFIFLSALFTGRIYFRLLERDGVGPMTSKLFLRTLKLYRYHVVLLLAAFVVAARIAISGHNQNLYNLLDFYFAAGPARAIADALLLVYRPPLLDIIPLYLIFLLLSPLILIAAAKFGWRWILGGSFALWLAAQFGLRQALYGFAVHYVGLRIPLNEMGAFNLWAWQLMWVLGMWCGARWAKDTLDVEEWARRAWIPAAMVAVALLVVRYAEIRGLNLGAWSIFFDKWHLGVVRLIDFAAIATLLIRFQSVVKPLAVRPLVLMGQSSLQVFCAHFVFCFLGLAWMGGNDRLYGWPQPVLVVVTFAALLLVARLFARPEINGAPNRSPSARPAVNAPASGY
ncbi:MAG TPA: OpgC domain-containing protein [Candidatus Baltobacteraceae bacterium]|nr:OpgC domain-containing protein [Candidatus Baltobacteraceae bacterium]